MSGVPRITGRILTLPHRARFPTLMRNGKGRWITFSQKRGALRICRFATEWIIWGTTAGSAIPGHWTLFPEWDISFFAGRASAAGNMLLVGPSNSGKSTIAEKFVRQHPRCTSAEGDRQIVSALSVQMPSDATAGRFYALLLDSLGAPVGQTRAADRRGALARKLMRKCEVRMLLFDELHNLLCIPVFRQRELLGVLRFLGNDLRIPIVALGTRDAYLALRLDDQLENRFQPFLLPRWRDNAETGRFLASFESVLPLREPSGLGLHELRSLIVSRSDGLIGEIHQLLTAASVHALNIGRERITADKIMFCSFEAPAYRRRIMERELRS